MKLIIYPYTFYLANLNYVNKADEGKISTDVCTYLLNELHIDSS